MHFEAPNAFADEAEIEAILREYLGHELQNLLEVSGHAVDLDGLIAATMSNLAAYLPPKGKTILARDLGGTLTGTIFLKFHTPNTAEIKRLFVRPSARGTGLGRSLATTMIDTARDMGATRILLDTGIWLDPAIALYGSLGFNQIPMYPESENDASLAEYLVYMELKL